VQLKARFPDFTTVTRAETLPEPTDRTDAVRDAARRLFDGQLERQGRPLRLIGLSMQNLVDPEARPPTLFPDPAGERSRTLDEIMDRAADRYGGKAITRGLPRRKPGA
jgi:DNA polymerase-4